MLQDSDLILSIGIVLMVLSALPLLSAWVEDRLSIIGTVMIIGGGFLTAYAFTLHETGYSMGDIPHAIYHTLAKYIL